jgi:hypothetical protein
MSVKFFISCMHGDLKCCAGAKEGAVPVAEVESALKTGLADLQWSGVGVLDGIADADSAVAACMHLIKWCAAAGIPLHTTEASLAASPVTRAMQQGDLTALGMVAAGGNF